MGAYLQKSFIWIILLVVLMLVVVTFRGQQTVQLSTTDFLTLLEAHRVSEVTLSETQAKGKISPGTAWPSELPPKTEELLTRALGTGAAASVIEFVCPNLSINARAITEKIDGLNATRRDSGQPLVQLKENPQSGWMLTALSTIFPILLIVGLWIFFLRQMQAGGRNAMSFGKSRARLNTDGDNKVTFDRN